MTKATQNEIQQSLELLGSFDRFGGGARNERQIKDPSFVVSVASGSPVIIGSEGADEGSHHGLFTIIHLKPNQFSGTALV
ncbi:hypothetical protein ACVWXN_007104 [Bradyrhizobium sp. i1.4.4]